jgi:dipeptidyl aminopeptidase/acylaminoacyl peptidase
MRKQAIALLVFLLASCSPLVTPAAPPAATAVIPTPTIVTPVPLSTPTLRPYEQYTIEALRKRTYGGGKIEVLQKLTETDQFSSYAIRYPSDGLNIYGFVNIPKGPGPFPVIVSIHGYAPYGSYDAFIPGADFADYFAQNQFVVVHPQLRNQPPSDNGDNVLRVGMSVDVLNLIALLKDQQNLPAEFAVANPNAMGLWGASLGGEIALRVLTVSPDIKATVLYSPMSGNSEMNARQLYEVVRDAQFQQDAQVPLELMDRISPMYFYHYVKSAVQLHHGMDDTTAPISWAAETCSFLQSAGVNVQCVYYPKEEHIFNKADQEKLKSTGLDFYKLYLKQ